MEKLLSAVIEDYLKAIYKLQAGTGKVSTSALAERLGVTAPSVTSMISRLAELGLVRHDRYRGVRLTESGTRAALEVIRHHRLWELFLATTLDIPIDQLHAEAERLEHTLSDELEERIDAVLGHPRRDPHGDPIPTREGTLIEDNARPLSTLDPGTEGTVSRVPDSDAAFLRYLTELGLVPGRRVRVAETAPIAGTLIVETGGERHAVSSTLASRILVDLAAE
jgi:DtxR family Mn-dependent transcriptional regulator